MLPTQSLTRASHIAQAMNATVRFTNVRSSQGQVGHGWQEDNEVLTVRRNKEVVEVSGVTLK